MMHDPSGDNSLRQRAEERLDMGDQQANSDAKSGVYVNDNEPGLIQDIDTWLEELAPARLEYRHHQTGVDNADAHLKSMLVHHEVIVPITNGKLDLDPWQAIFYAEFDGQRRKRVIVKVMGE